MKAKTAGCPRSDAAVMRSPSWSVRLNAGTPAAAGRVAPAQPLAGIAASELPPPRPASSTPTSPASTQMATVISARWMRASTTPEDSSTRRPGPAAAPLSCRRLGPPERSGHYDGGCVLAVFDTHLPNALRLLALVPYLSANACGSALRSALQVLAALTSVLTSALTVSVVFALAFWETHLPCALAPFLPVPYFWAKAAGSAAFSALHSCEAFCFAVSAATSVACVRLETHLPNALWRFLFVP